MPGAGGTAGGTAGGWARAKPLPTRKARALKNPIRIGNPPYSKEPVRRGIRAPGYITVVWAEEQANQHPEWRQIRKDGLPAGRRPLGPVVLHDWQWLCMNSPYAAPNPRLKSLSSTRSLGKPSWLRQASCAQGESMLMPNTCAPSARNSSILFPNSESSLVQPGEKSKT